MKAIHALVGTGSGARPYTLWCQEYSAVTVDGGDVVSGATVKRLRCTEVRVLVTTDMSKVTCKRCIALGGCGPR